MVNLILDRNYVRAGKGFPNAQNKMMTLFHSLVFLIVRDTGIWVSRSCSDTEAKIFMSQALIMPFS
jgi:hypothetical protein